MKFKVYQFNIQRKENRHGVFDKTFWSQISEKDETANLPSACGCYLFALKNGNNLTPWYVGKTEKRTFQEECFQAAKIVYYNEVLVDHSGKPILFLLPRLTNLGKKFSKPTRVGYSDINFLETMLIGMALEKNPSLLNIKKTKLLRQMEVPGIVNSPQAAPTIPVRRLKNALGI